MAQAQRVECPLVASGHSCLSGSKTHKVGERRLEECQQRLARINQGHESSDDTTAQSRRPESDWDSDSTGQGMTVNPSMRQHILNKSRNSHSYKSVSSPAEGVTNIDFGLRGSMTIVENDRDDYTVSFYNRNGEEEWTADMDDMQLSEALDGVSGDREERYRQRSRRRRKNHSLTQDVEKLAQGGGVWSKMFKWAESLFPRM